MGSFIETAKFPVKLVNEASAREKQGGGRPPHWEMVFWWTRKPLAGARAVIAASALPHDIDPSGFRVALRLDEGVAHRKNPARIAGWAERFAGIRLLDPFAGFGSIPLEAVRLGIGEVIAVELLPTAYIFLKAVLEYPKEYSGLRVRVSGKEIKELKLESIARKLAGAKEISDKRYYEVPALIYDVARWGRWVADRLREDPDIRDLYEEDVAVYIGTWEVRCPNTLCGRYTPLVGNWWLAKVKGRKTRYAYMKPKVVGDRVEVEIVEGEAGGAPHPNISAKSKRVGCLLCGVSIRYIDPETGTTYRSKKEARGKPRLEFYPNHALREWNKRLEEYLEGRITLEELKNSPARPRILAKVKITNNNLEFEPASREDVEKLWKALEKLRTMWGDPDIPVEELWKYHMGTAGQLSIWIWGYDKFYKLFNPRQLLTLVKLVKLIREAGKKIEEEKLREGWSREDAYKYAEAITTYLAIALIKYADYSSFVAGWNQSLIMGHSLSMRGLAMIWNYNDMTPWASWTGTFLRNLKS